jgi:hypothetical protein
MRNQLKIVYSALTIVATLGLTSTVQGVPAFARQTGLDCNSCHAASGFPTLNSFGAAFKAAGYTQGNDDEMIGDGEALSIPKTLNMSVVFKVRQPVEGSADGIKAPLENPDEIALLIGGRVAKNIGFLIEAGGTSLDFASMKVVFAPELGPLRLGIVPWWSDLGPGYIFETLSTGAVRNLRAMENRKLFSAQNNINYGGANDTMQTGLGLYVWNPMFFVVATPFFNTDAGTDWTSNAIGYYVRAAFTPTLGSLGDLGVGVQYYGGSNDDGAGGTVSMSTVAADLQLMMNIGLPLSVWVTFADDLVASAMSLNVAAEAALVPDLLMVDVAAAIGLANADTRVGAGVKFHITRNVKFEADFAYNTTKSEWQLLPLIFASF